MKDTSKTYKELGINYFREVFEIVDEIMKSTETPYYLVGATAIALELLKQGIKPARGTKDIDFALMVSDLDKYDKIIQLFLQKSFIKVKSPWTIRHPQYDIVVDLLPFGEIEEKHTENFHERQIDLHLLGIREVLSHANEVRIEQNIVNIPSFPGMIILKLIAWSDRPEDRDSDLKDILLIIQKSYDLNWDEIVESHYDLLDTENFDELMISAQLLGRKAANIISGFEELQERIYTVLEENLKEVEKSVIGIEWARRLNKDVHYAQKILNYFLKGLKDIRE